MPEDLLTVGRWSTGALPARARDEMVALCDEAYGVDTRPFFDDVGPGEHLLGRSGGRLVSHLMWVTRWLEPRGMNRMRTAYVELVATLPSEQGKGHASRLLETMLPLVQDFDVAALSTGSESFYARLGWSSWRGPLFVRRDGRWDRTPDDTVMLLPLHRTPGMDWSASLSIEWRPGEIW